MFRIAVCISIVYTCFVKVTIYPKIREKLRSKHQVSEDEVVEAFLNRDGELLEELRPQNQGDEPRYWFISETDAGRRLKVVFILAGNEPPIIITAYEPNDKEEEVYETYGKA